MLILAGLVRDQTLGAVEIRQRGGFFLRLVVASLLIHCGEAREGHELVGRAEGMARAGGVDLHGVIARVRHLAGDEAAPDELVQAVLLLGQIILDALRVEPDIAGTDSLVRILRALLLAEMARGTGIILRAITLADQLARGGQRLLGKAQRVGTHIGDQADGALGAQLHAFIELLCDRHGAPRRHIELARSLLLKRRGDKGRRRRAALFRTLDGRDGKLPARNVALDLECFLLAVQLALLAVAIVAGGEGAGLVQTAQEDIERPVFLRHKGLDLFFPFHDKTGRNGLHTPGRQAAPHLLPQQRTELITDDPVEDAPRLLRIDEIIVDVARLLNAARDDVFRDFIEGHALRLAVRQSEQLLQMPGNGLSFAVRVGCEIDAVRFLRRAFQF